MIDLRGLGPDDREKARRGFKLDVEGDGKLVQCCGKLMVFDRAIGRHVCQECRATDPPVNPAAARRRRDRERFGEPAVVFGPRRLP